MVMQFLQKWMLLCLLSIPLCLYALSVDDFVPDFLAGGNHAGESANLDSSKAFSLSDATKQRTLAGDDSYCDRVHQAFCAKENASAIIAHKTESGIPIKEVANLGANNQYFNPNSNNYDQNAVANFNITNSNQTALQGYAPKLNNYSTTDQIKSNLAVPIQADKNTNISVGATQINFNMSY